MAIIEEDLIVAVAVAVRPYPDHLALVVDLRITIRTYVIGNINGIPMAIIEEDLTVAVVPIPDHLAPVVDPRIIIITYVIGNINGIPMAIIEEDLIVAVA